MTAPHPSPNLPSILCLHGSGTNSEIFQIQTIRIRRELGNYFNFVFVDAPFECGPGPGVLPFFEDVGPFYTWMIREPSEARDPLKASIDMPSQTREVLAQAIREEKERNGGDRGFVGVLGFSMGGRLAAGLLLDQQRRQAEGTQPDGDDTHTQQSQHVEQSEDSLPSTSNQLEFGIFICATCPPITTIPISKGLAGTDAEGPLVQIPSLHVVGTGDPWHAEGELLIKKNFDTQTVIFHKLNMGHHFPAQKEDNAKVVKDILKISGKAI